MDEQVEKLRQLYMKRMEAEQRIVDAEPISRHASYSEGRLVVYEEIVEELRALLPTATAVKPPLNFRSFRAQPQMYCIMVGLAVVGASAVVQLFL